jgi:drug/metabolite transporter (DMT)-like permease
MTDRRRLLHIYSLLMLVILLKPFSNLFLAWGVRHFPQALSSDPLLFLRAMVDPLVVLGIVMQIIWLLARMSLLGVADLSFVLPVTATGYILTTVLGKVFLGEQVSGQRWIGASLIFLGTAFVGATLKQTRHPGPGQHR